MPTDRPSTPLSGREIDRYARHLILPEVGGAGQQALKAASVLVVGAGGLGAPLLAYLAAAGVGEIVLLDDDRVSLSNLQRQVLFGEDDLDRPKAEAAAARLTHLNPDIAVEARIERLTAANAPALLAKVDLVADGSDNFATRHLVADAAHLARRPLATGAVGRFEGQVGLFAAYAPGPDGTPTACYRCFLPEAPPPGAVPTCEEAGILGALPGVVGSLQAVEVLKHLLRIGTPLTGHLLRYDALAASTKISRIVPDPDCPLCGTNATIRDLSAHPS